MRKVAVATGKAFVLQRPEMLVFLVPVVGGQAFPRNPPQEKGVHFEFVPVDQLFQVFPQPGEYGQRPGHRRRDPKQPPQWYPFRDCFNHGLRQPGLDHRHRAVGQDHQQAENKQLRTALPRRPQAVQQVLPDCISSVLFHLAILS